MPWACRHPLDVPRDEWMRRLDSIPRPSPYLLPEWSLFWEDIWPHSRAEVWIPTGDEMFAGGIVLLRRRRWGLDWVFSQPYGTAGFLRAKPVRERIEFGAIRDIIETITDRRTVQVTFGAGGVTVVDVVGWRSVVLPAVTWILDVRDIPASGIASLFSTSHRRNIEKGKKCNPVFETITDRAGAAALSAAWKSPDRNRHSRIILNPRRGPAFAARFGPTGAMTWRVARVGGIPVAATLWLEHRDQAVYVDGVFERTSQNAGVNHYLFAQTLTDLFRHGVRVFDLGTGPGGKSPSGLAQFKKGWGAHPVTRYETVFRRPLYHWLRKAV